MALLKQCFCYSLRQGSFIIGSYSLVVYCVAFAVELWWIVESLLILPAPAYTLCALYFFDFIMAAILLFGLLVRQRKYLMSWTLMTVLSFFPEAGMVLFMSLYYWPAHKFEYGVIELVYWSLRAIFNIFGAVCVCSLYLTWRDEELILGRLHDLTLANVETGSTGVGVLRSGNFTGTLKGNNNLAYQNYAYVDSSPGLPDNLNYKNSNTFHSKCGLSPNSLRSFFATIPHPLDCVSTTTASTSRQSQAKNKHFYYYYYQHHNHFHRCCCAIGDDAASLFGCQPLDHPHNLQRQQPFSSGSGFHAKGDKVITSLPALWTEASHPFPEPGVVSYFSVQQQFHPHPLFVKKCGCCSVHLGSGGGGGGFLKSSANSGGDGKCKYLFCGIEHKYTCAGGGGVGGKRRCYKALSQNPTSHGPVSLLSRSERDVDKVVDCQHRVLQQTSEPFISGHYHHHHHSPHCAFSTLSPLKHKKVVRRTQSCGSSDSEVVGGGGLVSVPKIEIVICTEVHGSVETKVIRRPENHHQSNQLNQQQQQNNCRAKAYRKNSKLISIPFSHFRRAISDSPRVVIMEDQRQRNYQREEEDDSSIHSAPEEDGSMDSTSSIIADNNCVKKSKKYKSGHGNRNRRVSSQNGAHCNNEDAGSNGGDGGSSRGRSRFKILAYLQNMASCCVSRSNGSLLSHSGGSGDVADGAHGAAGGGGYGTGSLSHRGLYNRSFMNSDVHQATLGNRGATLAMKSEFNPAMLFDPAYRKSRISELGIAGIGLEPPGQLPIGTFNRGSRSRSLWNVTNEDYWNRPPPSRPVSLGYVNHVHQLDQMAAHKDCCFSMNNNSNATMNLNKQMIMKGGYGGPGCSQGGYRNPIHGSSTSVATSNYPTAATPAAKSLAPHHETCTFHREAERRRNWLAAGRRAHSVDGLNHFYNRHYLRNIAAHHNVHQGGGLLGGDYHSQDWSRSSQCPDDPVEDLRNYQDIAL